MSPFDMVYAIHALKLKHETRRLKNGGYLRQGYKR